MAKEIKQTKKTKNSTLAIDLDISNRLDFFCKKNNITKKDFIALALDYFDRTGVDIHSNDIVADLSVLNEKMDALIKFQADVSLKLSTIQQTTNILSEVKEDTTKLIEQKDSSKKGFFKRFSNKN